MVQESATVLQALFDLVLWAFIPLETKKAYYPLYTLKPSYRRIGIFLILLFCLFPFWGGDYFHYQQAFFFFNRGLCMVGFIPHLVFHIQLLGFVFGDVHYFC